MTLNLRLILAMFFKQSDKSRLLVLLFDASKPPIHATRKHSHHRYHNE